MSQSEVERKNLLYQLDLRCDKGLIRKQKHPVFPIWIYSYTMECTQKNAWDHITKKARGMILDKDGHIVARPFSKFFDYGSDFSGDAPKLPCDIYSKVDGSLLISYHYEGNWHLATRGSFKNDFVDFGQRYLDYYKHFPINYTICSEICLPKELDGLDRVVNHQPGVYLLGAVDLYSGKDIHLSKLETNWEGFKVERFEGTPETFAKLAREQIDTEGWVARWSNGHRVKIKTAWYFRLFRAVARMDERIREALMQGVSLKQVKLDFPDELHREVEKVYQYFQHAARQAEYDLLGKVLDHWQPTRQEFAKVILNLPDRGLMMEVYQNHPVMHLLIENVPLPEASKELIP